ncbi:MAG: efflux RND transporter periplasmic adaptor subunit [Caedimonadaceae bacterium]|nr:MAG: efflux RND transporter periplasmic adaptor subunit [Caedimonadaceae bacterium]
MFLSACEKNASQSTQSTPPEVTVMTIKMEEISLPKELPGRTVAHRIAEIRPQIDGLIIRRYFKEGSDVKKGEDLYQIDPALYKAAYDSAKASLAKSKALLNTNRLKVDRYKALIETRAISRQDYDDAVATLKQTEADVMLGKAAVETAQINLSYTTIKAPISGRIGRSSVTEGTLVTANQPTALSTVQQLDPMYIDLTQSSNDVLELKRELEKGHLKKVDEKHAKVHLILENAEIYKEFGSLEFTDVTVDTSTGAVILRALFPNPNQDLLPGMFVRAQLIEAMNANALLAPQRGITRDRTGNATAFVVNAQNVVELRIVKTDKMFGKSWVISKGLNVGDQIII